MKPYPQKAKPIWQPCRQHAPGTSVYAAHGIARVHDEDKNIVLLLLERVKFVKYLFYFIIYTINKLNE